VVVVMAWRRYGTVGEWIGAVALRGGDGKEGEGRRAAEQSRCCLRRDG
jgi:hypothetical protein